MSVADISVTHLPYSEAAILWKEDAINGCYQYEAILWEGDEHGFEGSFNEAKRLVNHYVSVHFMYKSTSTGTPATFFTEFGDYNQPLQFVSSPSFGGDFSTVPNIPLVMAKYIISWGFPESFWLDLFWALSDSSNTLLAASSCKDDSVTLHLRIHIVAVQQEGEDLVATKRRSYLNACKRSSSVVDIFNKETQLPWINQRVLHLSGDHHRDWTDDNCCSICLEEFRDSATATGLHTSELPCSHVYHYDCIIKWLWWSNCCPICRAAYHRM